MISISTKDAQRKQAIIDGPSTGVPSQAYPYRHLTLTPLTISKLPRGAGSAVVLKRFEADGVSEKWEKSSWAKKIAAVDARRKLNDFQRFGVMVAKKQRRDAVRKALAKA